MHPMSHRRLCLLALLFALPVAAHAQGLRSVEANVGLAVGRGGTFGSRTGFAADALVSVAIRPHANGMIVGAVSAGVASSRVGGACRTSRSSCHSRSGWGGRRRIVWPGSARVLLWFSPATDRARAPRVG